MLDHAFRARIGHEGCVIAQRELGSASIGYECDVSAWRGLGSNHTLRVKAMATADVARWTFEKGSIGDRDNSKTRPSELSIRCHESQVIALWRTILTLLEV